MLIAGAASGVSAAELENDIMNQDYRFANNVARVDDNGGAIYFEGNGILDQEFPFTNNYGRLDGNGGAIVPEGNDIITGDIIFTENYAP